jgi:hypothetical protein
MLHELWRIDQAHKLTQKPNRRLPIDETQPEDCVKSNRDDEATPQSGVNAQDAIERVVPDVGGPLVRSGDQESARYEENGNAWKREYYFIDPLLRVNIEMPNRMPDHDLSGRENPQQIKIIYFERASYFRIHFGDSQYSVERC